MARLDCGFGKDGEFRLGAIGDSELEVTPIKTRLKSQHPGEIGASS